MSNKKSKDSSRKNSQKKSSNTYSQSQNPIENFAHSEYTENIEDLKNLVETCKDDSKKHVDALFMLGHRYAKEEKIQEAKLTLATAIEICRNIAEVEPEYKPKLAAILDHMGILQEATNNLLEAGELYEEMLGIYIEYVNSEFSYIVYIAHTLRKLGNLLLELNQHEAAKERLEEALNIYKKIVAENPKSLEVYIANTLNNLGNIYNSVEEPLKAEQSLQEALEIYRNLTKSNPDNYTADVAMILNNLGLLKKNEGKLDIAEEMLNEALKIRRKLVLETQSKHDSDLASSLNSWGNLQKEKGNIKIAEDSYNEALAIYQTLANQSSNQYNPMVAQMLINKGALSLEKNKKQAFEYLDKAIDLLLPYKNVAQYHPFFGRAFFLLKKCGIDESYLDKKGLK